MVKIIDIHMQIPSANERLIKARYSSQLILSKRYRDAKEKLIHNMTGFTGISTEFFGVKIEIETYKDIDNCIKLILDAMKEVTHIDDRKCLSIIVEKKPIKRGSTDHLVVYAWGMEARSDTIN